MYNKEISEKMLDDAYDMMNNIRESRTICKEIVDRASIYLMLINLYTDLIVLNKEVNIARNYIRERYIYNNREN